jgi:small multidrug resistance pump
MVLLLVAIACEVTATSMLKESRGLTRLWPCVAVGIGYLGSFTLLATVLKRLPVGPVYAVWAGLGTSGAVMIGMVAYGDRLPIRGWLGIALVIAGVILLGVYAPKHV